MNSAFYFIINVVQSLGWLVLFAAALTVLFRVGDWLLVLVRGAAPEQAEFAKPKAAPRARKPRAAIKKADPDVIDVDMLEVNDHAPAGIGPSSASRPQALASPRRKSRGGAKAQDLAERICPNCDASLTGAVKDAQGVGYRCASCNQRVV